MTCPRCGAIPNLEDIRCRKCSFPFTMNVICENEAELSFRERLGLAWCRLNSGYWDDFLGPDTGNRRYARKVIESIISSAELNMYWNRFYLGKSFTEWFAWATAETARANEPDPREEQKEKRRRKWRIWR